MVELNLVKEDLFTCFWMGCDSLTYTFSLQYIVDPDAFRLGLTTYFVNRLLVSRLKETLPTHIKAWQKASHIHDLFLFKPFKQRAVDNLTKLSTIYNWRSPTLLGGYSTKEPDFCRPLVHM